MMSVRGHERKRHVGVFFFFFLTLMQAEAGGLYETRGVKEMMHNNGVNIQDVPKNVLAL